MRNVLVAALTPSCVAVELGGVTEGGISRPATSAELTTTLDTALRTALDEPRAWHGASDEATFIGSFQETVGALLGGLDARGKATGQPELLGDALAALDSKVVVVIQREHGLPQAAGCMRESIASGARPMRLGVNAGKAELSVYPSWRNQNGARCVGVVVERQHGEDYCWHGCAPRTLTRTVSFVLIGAAVLATVWASYRLGYFAGVVAMQSKLRNCFVAATAVATAEGQRPIELINTGDLVWSRDEDAAEVELKPVLQTFVTDDQPVLALTLRGGRGRRETLGVTPGHPFWVRGKGWTDAAMLKPDDNVARVTQSLSKRLRSGTGMAVQAIEAVPNPRTVHNLEVEGSHTYLAGTSQVWVHNESIGPPDDTCPMCIHKGNAKDGDPSTWTFIAAGTEAELAAQGHLSKWGTSKTSTRRVEVWQCDTCGTKVHEDGLDIF